MHFTWEFCFIYILQSKAEKHFETYCEKGDSMRVNIGPNAKTLQYVFVSPSTALVIDGHYCWSCQGIGGGT